MYRSHFGVGRCAGWDSAGGTNPVIIVAERPRHKAKTGVHNPVWKNPHALEAERANHFAAAFRNAANAASSRVTGIGSFVVCIQRFSRA